MIVVGFSVPDVICCVDGEIGGVDGVTFADGFEHLGVVDDSVLFEMDLLVLNQGICTFKLIPQTLNSYNSTLRSYLSWPYSVKKSALSLLCFRLHHKENQLNEPLPLALLVFVLELVVY